MTFGGSASSELPYAGAPGEDYVVYISMNILMPVSLLFYGEVGDVVFLPPGIEIPPVNVNDRMSPCLTYDNEDM